MESATCWSFATSKSLKLNCQYLYLGFPRSGISPPNLTKLTRVG
ncbi:hypothetical protein SOVF_003880 [Spinacia oleracea]|nr:hypothetical protein SOVF_003880 [Spinacia oleracea]